MKHVISLLLITGILNATGLAQCDQKILYTSVKQEWLNSKDEIQKNDQDKVTLEVDKTNIRLNHNDDSNDEMKGIIKNVNCNWSEAYKNGKSIIQAELTEGHNDVHDATITIEGKDGSITILIELKDHPDMRIKAYVDKYEKES